MSLKAILHNWKQDVIEEAKAALGSVEGESTKVSTEVVSVARKDWNRILSRLQTLEDKVWPKTGEKS